jgi:hypothetical protein
MTDHNSRNTNNSRNESNYRTANTVWTPAKAGMLAKVAKPATSCIEANSSRDSRCKDNRIIMDVISIHH